MVIMNIQTCVNVFPDSIKTDSRTSHVESEPTGPSVAPVRNQQPPSHCQDSPHPGHSTQLQGEGQTHRNSVMHILHFLLHCKTIISLRSSKNLF